jgi:hypothetical protein
MSRPFGQTLTVILPGKTIGTYQVGRGSAAAPVTRTERAIVAGTTRLYLTFQSQRTGPGAGQGERDAQLKCTTRGLAASPLTMSIQAPIQIVSSKPEVCCIGP